MYTVTTINTDWGLGLYYYQWKGGGDSYNREATRLVKVPGFIIYVIQCYG